MQFGWNISKLQLQSTIQNILIDFIKVSKA